MQNETNINTYTKKNYYSLIYASDYKIIWKKILTRCLHGLRSKNYQCEKVTYTYIIGIIYIRYTCT